MNWLHILGADIPHHNRTLLAFFNEQIAPNVVEKPQFWVVSKTDLASEFPQLSIRLFPSKLALAKAVMVKSWRNPTACFFFHGQYNAPLWLAMLFGLLPAKHCAWHIWGADLYENSTSLGFRLFYPLRRLAQKRLKYVLGTQGDLDYFSKIHPKSHRLLLYFPTKMPFDILPSFVEGEGKFILLGNSGDPSNHHLFGLQQLHQQFGADIQIKIPMGYPENNDAYIEQVAALGKQLFGENCEVWRERAEFAKYVADLTACDLGYFPFERQQGIGTLCLLIALNVPFALSRNNPFCVDLIAEHVPFLSLDQLTVANIADARNQLKMRDKSQIRFFPLHYRQMWLEQLERLFKEI
ncbi:hypothetical protein A1D29_11190 [Pasteurellaceae bacterium Orientalotternb1]|nr:hypothetical protein A1D29_11190 [Pasteurellaceae bacterium Orientalotternb1]